MIFDTYGDYIITDTIRINDKHFVLGVHLQKANTFATWRRTLGGAYCEQQDFTDLLSAEKSLVERASEEIKFIEICQAVKEQSERHREHER